MRDIERFNAVTEYERELLPGGLALDVDADGEAVTVADYKPCDVCGEVPNERVRMTGELDTPSGAEPITSWVCTPCSLITVNGYEPSGYDDDDDETALHMTPEDVAYFNLT